MGDPKAEKNVKSLKSTSLYQLLYGIRRKNNDKPHIIRIPHGKESGEVPAEFPKVTGRY